MAAGLFRKLAALFCSNCRDMQFEKRNVPTMSASTRPARHIEVKFRPGRVHPTRPCRRRSARAPPIPRKKTYETLVRNTLSAPVVGDEKRDGRRQRRPRTDRAGTVSAPEPRSARSAEGGQAQRPERKVVEFNDYVQPNAALDAGDLEANSFQHQPYLDSQVKQRG